MIQVLDLRIRQMHAALDDLRDTDASSIASSVAVVHGATHSGYYWHVDFSQGSTPEGLANRVTILVGNIARMRDHLKAWCSRHNRSFEGDALINSNSEVALVHDLNNTEKHYELNRPPRSGRRPRIQNLRQILRVSTGASAGSSAGVSFDPRTGKMTLSSPGGAALVLEGEVTDEHGNILGLFPDICEKAVAAWEYELLRAGVPLPPR